MKHLFVPYELAVKLKEKGFDEPCLYTVHKEDAGDVYNGHEMEWVNWNKYGTTNVSVSAPLYQQVTNFFREKYFIHITIKMTCSVNEVIDIKGNINFMIDEFRSPDVEVEETDFSYYGTLSKTIEEALKYI